MDTSLQFRPEDRLQKTWIPEGTKEYKIFKLITLENRFLAKILKERFPLAPGELLLDVGGREGDIGLELQAPEYFHLVDPDPTLKLSFKPGKYWNERIQDIQLADQYKLIVCCHVLGYLGTQHVLSEVFHQLIKSIAPGGTLALFYNTCEDYTGELLEYSKEILPDGHYDYFDENLLLQLDSSKFIISHEDISFELEYDSWEDLGRCCWFLYGARDQDIEGVAAKFIPKLKKDLMKPTFPIPERVMFVTRNV